MCNFLNLFNTVKVGPFFSDCSCILKRGECVQPAGRNHVASAVVGEEMLSPVLFSTPAGSNCPQLCQQQGTCVCTKPVPLLAVVGSCSEAWAINEVRGQVSDHTCSLQMLW